MHNKLELSKRLRLKKWGFMANYFYYPTMLFKQLFYKKKAKKICFSDIGWELTLPKNFELLSEKQIIRSGKKAQKVLDLILDRRVKYPSRGMLFIAHYEMRNKVSVSIGNLNELSEDDWKAQNDDIFNSLLKIYHYRYKDFAHVSINTENGARQKGDIVFNTRDIVATTPTRELYRSRHYSMVYKNFGILVSMAFAEEKIGEEMLDILRNSTFAN